MNTKTKNYMSNKEFFEEIVKCQQEGKISNRLGYMFSMLVERYATKHQFSGYTYNDEMVAWGKLACVASFQKFDPNRGKVPNPFAFFTSVTHNSFLQVLNKEKRQQNIRDKMLVEANMTPSFSYQDAMSTEWADQQEKIEQENHEIEDDSDEEPTSYDE